MRKSCEPRRAPVLQGVMIARLLDTGLKSSCWCYEHPFPAGMLPWRCSVPAVTQPVASEVRSLGLGGGFPIIPSPGTGRSSSRGAECHRGCPC